jgi:DNA-binding response OmpR family regulator
MSSIYVVDGNAADRELVFAALCEEDHDVMCFSDSRVALRTCARKPPALLITEAVLADMTGFGLIRRVRAIAADVAVLVFTNAYTREDVRERTRGADRVGYLGKPAAAPSIRAAGMALLTPAPPASPPEPELLIRGWRTEVLEREGYPRAVAVLIATHPEVELQAAVDLVRRGCHPELAARILV